MTTNQKSSAKNTLMDVLEQLLHKKSFQKISVNELCEAAAVSRSTFYANFENKYDLLACCLESKSAEITVLAETLPPAQFFSLTLAFIQTNGRFFYKAFEANMDQETLSVLYAFFEKHLLAFLKEKAAKGQSLPEPLEVTAAFYIGGLTSTTLHWIKSNYKLPKETIASCQCRLLKDIL